MKKQKQTTKSRGSRPAPRQSKPSRPKVRRGRGKGRTGRPIEATPAVLAQIAKHVEDGNYIEAAADLEGFDISTMRTLLRDGARELRRMAIDGDKKPARGLERAAAFARDMRRARAKAEQDDLGIIRKAAKGGQWQASAWRLERRQPDRWARRDRHEVSGPGGGAIPVAGVVVTPEQLKDVSDEELDAIEKVLKRLGGNRPADPGADSGGEGTPRG